MTKGFPYTSLPTGWFQVGWSEELAPSSAPQPMRYFGCDLVIYRGESGAATVMDAHCQHMGAHLAYGGRVCGDRIVCPYHGWEWSVEGRNVQIPYSSSTSSRSIRVWEVREVAGMVLVWHDAEGAPPSWEVPDLPEAHDPAFYPAYPNSAMHWSDLRMPAQLVAENIVDPVHFKYVHGNTDIGDTEHYEADGPVFRATSKLTFGGGRERTWLTPNGPVRGTQEFECYGIGVVVTRFPDTDGAVEIDCATPIEAGMSDRRSTVITRRMPGDTSDGPAGASAKRVETTFRLAAQDFPVWENQRYLARPGFVKEEAQPMAQLRKWAAQFYPHESAAKISPSG